MQNYNFSYDSDNDDLFLFSPKSKSKGSVELGNIILDYNDKKELVGIQIRSASDLIKDICKDSLSDIKEVLRDMVKCKIETKTKNNLCIIKLFLFSKLKEITPVIPVPRITESSPALAYA